MSDHITVLQHPTLGPIRGINKASGVTQYLGVQYASLTDRFSRGELLNAYPSGLSRVRNGALDATSIGPLPLSPENGCQWEHGLIQQSLPAPIFEQSDTECLTVNIAVPEGQCGKLPVMAFVHGGAFATGSSSYPQYDLAQIVKSSVEIRQPIVAVGINYRLGIPGFLYSPAMEAAGYKPNNGLHDQRLGLLWIKRHISGFHGDPEQVTYVGESSGAASGCFHLHSSEPLFSQLIAMSGSSLVKAKPLELAERSFRTALQLLDGDAAPTSDSDQVYRLLTAPMSDIRDKIGRKAPLGPLVDGDLIPAVTTYSTLADPAKTAALFPGLKWCKRILFGDCQMDGSAYAPRLSPRTDPLPQSLAAHLAATLDPIDPSLAPEIISGYGLDLASPSSSSNTPHSTKPVLDLATDVCFALAARAFVRAWSGTNTTADTHDEDDSNEEEQEGREAFLYRFNVPNPWPGPWKGHATHILDIVFLLQNYREKLAVGQRKTGDRMAREVVAFVNGGKPWPAYGMGEKEGVMVYYAAEDAEEDGSGYVEDERLGATGRRDVLQRVMGQESWDGVMSAWEGFMKGPYEGVGGKS